MPGRCTIPYCLLGEGFHNPPMGPRTARLSPPASHVKTEDCCRCPFTGWCEGVFRDHIALYGIDELREAASRMAFAGG